MATLEDKILGEKLHNYCSSSEDEYSDCDNSDSEEGKVKGTKEEAPQLPEPNKWEGSSTNTGPKGVIKDWQRFKQLEAEKRVDDEKERIELMKKLTLTVQSALDEEKAKNEDPDLAELLNDDFLLNYQKQRMQEMLQQTEHNLKFGKLIYLNNGDEYLDAIDNENKAVKIVVHIYENNVPACRLMNEAFEELSKIYQSVKFCAIIGSHAGLSRCFKNNGVPAILIYKAGQVVGNFVRLTDDLGNDFDVEDVQGYLVEHGMLDDKTCKPLIIRNGDGDDEDDSD
ncbi:PREDICTED: phosducin-like protein [Nicrophorus vespilloides]|uniref:Phosducin-like protein n=1 Tax=Nicrophorus vespilloides TaxID=110193 RepID=A0ABM1ME60_NICVS|nr:PREDICTED: phosducin-like protein [Nicrophorus vespilloides]